MTDEQLLESMEWYLTVAQKCGSATLSKEEFSGLCDLINRQKTEIDILIRKKETLRDEIAEKDAEIERLEYVLMAVMHSVDKWLEGDELKQDEANRACAMREKTLKITEKLHKKIDGLKKANQERWVAIEKKKAEIERLQKAIKVQDIMIEQQDYKILSAKSEAYREFAVKAKEATFHYYDSEIDDVAKELTEKNDKG